ncbi:exosortase C-terminal domain/associated protein EpsI [Thermogutta sp.]|uniref:exosortase C-terminal domain/associated protein EpsI n=1 Tax=Thermogutta sp. TaxID=1962930 RepID=UPI00322052ED
MSRRKRRQLALIAPRPKPMDSDVGAGAEKPRPVIAIPLQVRAAVVVVSLVLVGLGARWAASQAVPSEVRLPKREQLLSFPYQLGPWQGEDERVDEKVLQVVGAELTLNRTYRQSAERFIGFHAAVFTHTDFSLPHPPELCYGGTGWRVRSTKDARLVLSHGTSGTVRILSLEKESGGQAATVLYCYQLAGPFAAERDAVRRLFWRYRGQKSRPPLVKVMFHLPGAGPDVEEEALDFARRALEKLAEMEKNW